MKQGIIALLLLVLLIIMGGLVYWYGWLAAPEKPAPEPKPRLSAAQRYCQTDHDKADIKTLARQGGLTQILAQPDDIDNIYDCAAAYLDNGGDVNAKNKKQLTPLFIAIRQNDARLVKFLLKHGADPRQRAGKKDLRAYGYAVYRAMRDQKDYNDVIEQLDSAMEQ